MMLQRLDNMHSKGIRAICKRFDFIGKNVINSFVRLINLNLCSWGGKRNRGPQKIVIRTPFHAWGGKRSEMSDELE